MRRYSLSVSSVSVRPEAVVLGASAGAVVVEKMWDVDFISCLAVVSAVEAVAKTVAPLVELREVDLLKDVAALLASGSRYSDVTTGSGFAECEISEGVSAMAWVEVVEDIPASCGMRIVNVALAVFGPAPTVVGLLEREALAVVVGLNCSVWGIWVPAWKMTVKGAEVEVGDNTETELLLPDFLVVATSLVKWLEAEAGMWPEVGEEAVDDMASARKPELPGAFEALAVVS